MSRRTASVVCAALVAACALLAPVARATTSHGPARDPVVLVVHLRRGEQDRGAATDAAGSTASVAVRHVFPAENAFSVAVPRAGLRAALGSLRALPGVVSVSRPPTRTFSTVPDDPRFGRQRSYLDAVDAPAAWAANHASQHVTIAVVDSGIDVHHPDLAPQLVGTHNAHNGGSSIVDTVGHGTFVAGVAAAATDNGVGVAGASFGASLLGVKVADQQGRISVDDEVAGIRWAVAHGASIVNLSLGGPDPSALERHAVERAIAHGVVVVAAAGNGSSQHREYPAAYPGVLAVGATNPALQRRAGFSNHGSWVSVGAPGVGIYSTVPLHASTDFPGSTSYARGSGTSFATPLVSAEVALIRSKNPGLSVARVDGTVTASAHGFGGQGVGAGQVDFARALASTPPTTVPTSLDVTGDGDHITFTAGSAASSVAFRIDGDPLPAPTPVSGGRAVLRWPSYGYADGTHTLRAYNCSSLGACGTRAVSATFRIHDAPAVIATPANGSRVTGRFAVRARRPGGGALRLTVDGRRAGFATAAPYVFHVNGSALSRGPHKLRVRLCSADGAHCAGPVSRAVRIRVSALHPSVLGLAPRAISPNGDGVQDTATLRFALPSAQSVRVRTLDANGTVLRSDALGRLRAGRHSWVWRGAGLPDGRYVLAVATRRVAAAGTWRGWGEQAGVVDTAKPRLHVPTGESAFFPRPDGYRDHFAVATAVSEPARLALLVRAPDGRLAAKVTRHVAAGPATLRWRGRTADRVAAPGTYRWRLRATDRAGNSRTTRSRQLHVSGRRLVTLRDTRWRAGSTSRDFGGTDGSCTSASTGASSFGDGLLLRNSCRTGSVDIAYARYAFVLPAAHEYERLTLLVDGRASRVPTRLSASFERTDERVEHVSVARVGHAGEGVVPLGSAPAAGHLTRRGRVFADVFVNSRYPGPNAFDLRRVGLRVRYRALR